MLLKRLVLVIITMSFTLLCLTISCAQNAKKKNTVHYIYNLPFKKGFLRPIDKSLKEVPMGVIICSKGSKVFSISNGDILKIDNDNDNNSHSIFIKNGDTIYIYSNLARLKLNESNKINKGDFLGYAKKSRDKKKYELTFQVFVNRIDYLDYERVNQYLIMKFGIH